LALSFEKNRTREKAQQKSEYYTRSHVHQSLLGRYGAPLEFNKEIADHHATPAFSQSWNNKKVILKITPRKKRKHYRRNRRKRFLLRQLFFSVSFFIIFFLFLFCFTNLEFYQLVTTKIRNFYMYFIFNFSPPNRKINFYSNFNVILVLLKYSSFYLSSSNVSTFLFSNVRHVLFFSRDPFTTKHRTTQYPYFFFFFLLNRIRVLGLL
jgi:hypothetical protein